MNKAAIIGIVVAVIAIGILVSISLDSFSNLKDDDLASGPSPEKEVEDSENEKPPGRNLSVELDEKMGLSAP